MQAQNHKNADRESAPPPALSIVVPCYDEAENLPALRLRLQQAARQVAGENWELILVDDGSHDRSWDLIQDFAREQPNIRGLSLSRNFGQAAASYAGLRAARGQRILLLDADLQDPPELLPQLMQLLDNGADLALARRGARSGEPAYRKIGAWCFYRILAYLAEIDIPADTGDFRLMSRKFLDTLLQMPEPDPYIKGLSAWIGFKQAHVSFQRDPRAAGRSKYAPRALAHLALGAITGFSVRPLRLAWVLAALFALLALLATSADTAPLLLSALFAVAAVQTALLAILGEYVGRIRIEAKQRPLYIVAEDTRANAENRNT